MYSYRFISVLLLELFFWFGATRPHHNFFVQGRLKDTVNDRWCVAVPHPSGGGHTDGAPPCRIPLSVSFRRVV